MHRVRILHTLLSIGTLERRGRYFSSKTFVSEHYSPDAEDMKKVISAMDSDTRLQNDGVLSVKICRLCTKGNKDDMGNLWKLLIRKDGSFHCYRCTQGLNTTSRHHMILSRAFLPCHSILVYKTFPIISINRKFTSWIIESLGGNWIDLKKRTLGTGGHVQLLYAKDSFEEGTSSSFAKAKILAPVVIPTTLALFGHVPESVNGQNAFKVLEFLNGVRGLNNGVLLRYGVNMAVEKFLSDNGQWEDQLCVTFPWIMSKEKETIPGGKASEGETVMKTVRVKYRLA